jgi:hypothetical protein
MHIRAIFFVLYYTKKIRYESNNFFCPHVAQLFQLDTDKKKH